MKTRFYKMRKGKWFCGVLAGLADSFHINLSLMRILFLLFSFMEYGIGFLIYLVLIFVLPYKEDLIEEAYGTGPRKRKNADKIR